MALRMSAPAPKTELMQSLGQLVRGLSALFWGLPLALVLGVQTARTDWLRPFGPFPPVAAAGLLFFGLLQLEHFQREERVWRAAIERAKLLALVNVGLSPFLFFWHVLPGEAFFGQVVMVLALTSLAFLFALNRVLQRLTALLPDETLRLETRLFTTLNLYLLVAMLLVVTGYFGLAYLPALPRLLFRMRLLLDRESLWLLILMVLLPVATTMALLWKTKEVILAGVFGMEN
jgi:hypothetical protein